MKKITKSLLLLATGFAFTFGFAACSNDDTSDSENNGSSSTPSASTTRSLQGSLEGTEGTVTITDAQYVFKDSDGTNLLKGSVKSVADAYLYLSIEEDYDEQWKKRSEDQITYDYLKLSASTSESAYLARSTGSSSYSSFKAYQLEKEDYDAGTVYKVYENMTGDLFVAPATNKFKVMLQGVKSLSGDCKLSGGKLLMKYESAGQTNYTAYTINETTGTSSVDLTASVDASSYEAATAETIEAPASSGTSGSSSESGSGNSGSGSGESSSGSGEGEHEHGSESGEGTGEQTSTTDTITVVFISDGKVQHTEQIPVSAVTGNFAYKLYSDANGTTEVSAADVVKGNTYYAITSNGAAPGTGGSESGQGGESASGTETSYEILDPKGNAIKTITAAEFEEYKNHLTEGIDYSINGTTITLTESGMETAASLLYGGEESGEHGHGTGEGESGQGEEEHGSESGEGKETGSYIVVYNDYQVATLTAEEYAQISQLLTAETDYSIYGTTITLTESGMQKAASFLSGGEESGEHSHGTGEGDETSVPMYAVVYNDSPVASLTAEEYAQISQLLTAGTDYSIYGTTITLTESGMQKAASFLSGGEESGEHGHGTGESESGEEYPTTGETVTVIYVTNGVPQTESSITIPVAYLSSMLAGEKLYSDAACQNEVAVTDVEAGKTYYALMTVTGGDDYPDYPGTGETDYPETGDITYYPVWYNGAALGEGFSMPLEVLQNMNFVEGTDYSFDNKKITILTEAAYNTLMSMVVSETM